MELFRVTKYTQRRHVNIKARERPVRIFKL